MLCNATAQTREPVGNHVMFHSAFGSVTGIVSPFTDSATKSSLLQLTSGLKFNGSFVIFECDSL